MAIIKAAKIATDLVAFGTVDIHGFTISVHSPTSEFESLASLEIDSNDGTWSPAEQLIIDDFIALMNLKLI